MLINRFHLRVEWGDCDAAGASETNPFPWPPPFAGVTNASKAIAF
jgi:hypothetical protein